MTLRILGFDPGLANTGWGVIDAGKNRFVCIAYGSISTPSDLSPGNRLDMIFKKSSEIIEEFKPSAAGIESLYFSKNITSAIPVAQARGILLLSLFQNGITAKEYTPQQIKQSITGNGKAEKQQIQQMLKIILGLNDVPKPDHAADALGAAVCCYNSYLFDSEGGRAQDV